MRAKKLDLRSAFPAFELSRRRALATTAGICGLSLPSFLQLQSTAAADRSAVIQSMIPARAKSCIIIYLWGGMSHLESLDLKPNAPAEVRGLFNPIETVVPGIEIGEHLPLLSRHTDKLAIVRSIHHDDAAHGRGMYWNLTGHKPPRGAAFNLEITAAIDGQSSRIGGMLPARGGLWPVRFQYIPRP